MPHRKAKSPYQRITNVQLQFFHQFSWKHPEILKKGMQYDNVERKKQMWEELAQQLNKLKGPKRTPDKWRQKFVHWKNQRRCRARKELTKKETIFSDDLECSSDFPLQSTLENEMYDAPVAEDQYFNPAYADYTPSLPTALQELVSMNDKLSSSQPPTETIETKEFIIKTEDIPSPAPLEQTPSIAQPTVSVSYEEKVAEEEEDTRNLHLPSPQSTSNSTQTQNRCNDNPCTSIADIFSEAVKLWNAAEERQQQRHLETMKMQTSMVAAMESVANEIKILGSAMKSLTDSIHENVQRKPNGTAL